MFHHRHHRNFFPNMMTNPWITGHMFSCISLWMHQANKWTSNRACALKELWNAFNVVFIKIQRQQLQECNPTSKCQNLIYVLSFWSKNCQTVFSCCYNFAIIVVRPEISSQCCQKQTRGMCVQPCSSPSRRPGFVNSRSAVEEDLKSSASSAQPWRMNGPSEIKTLTIWKHFDWVAKHTLPPFVTTTHS